MSNPTGIEALVCADIARRQAHGVQKYGQTVAANPLPLRAWLQHAYEESLDFSIYLRRAMEERDGGRLEEPAAGAIPQAFLVGQQNLINTLIVALEKLGAPEDTRRALTENGDVAHVHWWLTEKRVAVAKELRYTWSTEEGDGYSLGFATIAEAVADADREMSDRRASGEVMVFDSRPAAPADRELFERSEDVAPIDFENPDWYERFRVPTDCVASSL